MKQKNKKIYISLDSLIDTRLGVLNTIDVDFAIDVVSDKKYFNREIDSFVDSKGDVLSNELYSKVSKKYSYVLSNSVKTKMFIFLMQLCHAHIQQALTSPVKATLEIDINTYPYELDNNEVSKLLPVVSASIGNLFDINCIYVPYEKLTIDFITDNYNAMIMYNYHDWLNKHELALKRKPVKGLVVYVPKIYFGQVPDKDDLKKLSDEGTDAFAFTKKILSPLIEIDYLPINLYCIDSPFNIVD